MENEDINSKEPANLKIPQKKKDKGNLIAICISIVLAIIVVLGYKFIIAKDKDDKKDENEGEKENTAVLNYTMNVYKNSDNYYCLEESEYCNIVAFTIKTETEDAKILALDDSLTSNFILYDDNGLKIYNIKTKEINKTNLEDDYEYYNLISNDTKSQASGIIYKEKDSDYKGYYNVLTNKKMYEKTYTHIEEAGQSEYLSAGFYKDGKAHIFLLKTSEEKVELETSESIELETYNSGGNSYFTAVKTKDNYFYFLKGFDTVGIINIYSSKKEVLASNIGMSRCYSLYQGNLYISDNGILKKYDADGNVLKTISTIKKENILQIINNYVIYIDNSDYLSIMNIDNSNENKQLVKWDSGNLMYDDYSTYYTKEELKELGKDTEEGIYILTYYNGGIDSNGNYGIEYCYTKDGNVIEYPIEHAMGGRAKPVLYLYPKEKMQVTVKFQHPEYLTTTYPKYQDKWEVIASPNGDLQDDNKYYYALYWDEIRHDEVNFQEGFYVTKENAINFLEEKLKIIGLNDRERNEFIMYWLPILETNEKSLVYFELTNERELNNKLIITPKPDSMLRVSIHIKKVDKEIKIKEQKLPTFKRNGFTAIEWGGMVY